MRILYDSLADTIVDITSGEEPTMVAGFPSENLLIPDPGVIARTTDLFTGTGAVEGWVFDVGAVNHAPGRAYNMIAVIGTNFSQHANGMTDGNELPNWTTSNATSAATTDDGPTGALACKTQKLTATGASARITNAAEVKSAAEVQTVVMSLVAKDWGGDAVTSHVRLNAEGASSSHRAFADFNLTTGAVNGVFGVGNFANITAGVIVGADGWFRAWVKFDTDAHPTLTPSVLLLDTSFVNSGTTNEVVLAGGAQFDFFATEVQPLTLSRNTIDRAPFWRIATDWSGVNPVVTPVHDSGWMNWIRYPGDLQDQDFTSNYYVLPADRIERYIHLYHADPKNPTTSNVDLGRVMAGKSLDLSGSLAHEEGVSISYEESGGEAIMRGGQIIRGVNNKRRVIEVNLHYMDRDTAIFELGKLSKVAGRSQMVFAAIDDSAGPVGEEFSIYGYIDVLEPRRHLSVDRWGTTLRIRERIP